MNAWRLELRTSNIFHHHRLLMKRYYKSLCAVLSLLTSACFCIAQDIIKDSSFVAQAAARTIENYYVYSGQQSRVYNGREHIGYSPKITGYAYLDSNFYQQGTVYYDKLRFHDVPLKYDLYTDKLIVRHFNNYLNIILQSERLDSFSIGNRHFVHDTLRISPQPKGFYEVLYNGNTTLYVKRIKLLQETVTDHIEREFIEKNYYFVKLNGQWKSIKSRRGLFHTFPDQAKTIRQWLRKNRIIFRKDREKAILGAVKLVDELNP